MERQSETFPNPAGNESLNPQKSIFVFVSTFPDTELAATIAQQIGNIDVGETINLAQDKWQATLKQLKGRLSSFQHGTLVLHESEEQGLRSAMAGILLGQHVKNVDIAILSGGWDREKQKFSYSLSKILPFENN